MTATQSAKRKRNTRVSIEFVLSPSSRLTRFRIHAQRAWITARTIRALVRSSARMRGAAPLLAVPWAVRVRSINGAILRAEA